MTDTIHIVGKVKMISHDKGFGFIRRDDSHDLFFHISECVKRPDFERMREGSMVKFVPGPGKRGEEGREIILVSV